MKKYFIIAALLLAASLQLGAVPAYRGLIPYTQPDGKVIQIRLHGDEFYHWVTDSQGRVVELNDDGYYYPVSAHVHQARRIAGQRRRDAVNQARFNSRSNKNVAIGQKHFLVILVEFSDVHFSSATANSDFTNLMNQVGYNVNGATGSARDFYYDNSHGAFEPIFDVYGPVTLNNSMSHYGGNTSSEPGSDRQPHLAVKEGCEALASEIDFSQYDNDGDGTVDLVFMYYAGKGENDGGGKDCIWPHQWSLSSGGINLNLGGKRINKYACSNEIVNVGALAGKMCGIGTACHEFGHAMGLPDFYDVNYEEDGEASGLYEFSTMCGGAYNNSGRTPPYFNIEERMILGWIDSSAMSEINESGQYSLTTVDNNVAYKTSCDTEGEYFYFEARCGQGWDAPLPKGLLIYHVDKSKTRKLGGYYTPYELWANWEMSNAINRWGSHPCFYIIPSIDPTVLYLDGYDYGYKDNSDIIFPGRAGRTSYEPLDWDGNDTAVSISSINYSSNKATFTATVMNNRGVSGTVTDSSGNPIQGVSVSVTLANSTTTSSNGRARIISVRAAAEGAAYVTQTDAEGRYQINLEDCAATDVVVTAAHDEYIAASKTIQLKTKGNVVNFSLRKVSEGVTSTLYKFDVTASNGSAIGTGADIMASVYFSQQELSAYAGDLIKSVSFLPTCDVAKAVYVIIDFGSTRALTYKIPDTVFNSDIITVSLEDQNLRIPDDRPAYFGYGVAVESGDEYAIGCFPTSSFNGSYYGSLNLYSSTWYQLSTSTSNYDLVYAVTVEKEDVVTAFNYIDIPENFVFTAGAELPLHLITSPRYKPSSVVWTLDGQTVNEDSIILTSGDHTLRATIYYSDGSDETIELEFEVL